MKKLKRFTLIELLAVIAILGIITLITVPSIKKIMDDARKRSIEGLTDKYGYWTKSASSLNNQSAFFVHYVIGTPLMVV